MEKLVDSHCHLDFECFDIDRADVLKRCARHSITTIIVPGTQAKRWSTQISICQAYPQLRFALGLHPYFLNSYQPKHLKTLGELIESNAEQIVALGEIGLDHAIDVERDVQLDIFCRQLALANEYSLPVILHHRKSHNDLIRVLKKERFLNGGIVHAFSGSLQQAMAYVALGFKIGVGGTITYERANKTRDAIRQLPLSSLVLETDSPDMPLMGRQGLRNSPEYLPDILSALLTLRAEPRELVVEACFENVKAGLTNL